MNSTMCHSRGLCPTILACDGGYSAQLATTLRSLTEANHRSWPIPICVLVEGFSADLRERVFQSLPAGSAVIDWLEVDLAPFRGLSTLKHISRITYARLLIPRILPETVTKALYLDTDILVLGDLRPLWEVSLDDHVVGAVSDISAADIKRLDPRFVGVPRVRDYFNAGVLLMDVRRWREEQISERALRYLEANPASPLSDQDALNVACDGRWKAMDTTWNFQNHLRVRLANLETRPAIVHFVTDMKPWKPGEGSLNADLYNLFRGRTLFDRTPLTKILDVTSPRVRWYRAKQMLRGSQFARRVWRGIVRKWPARLACRSRGSR